MAEQPTPPSAVLRTDQPSTARVYDYYLGGKDNFPADREAAEQALARSPLPRLAALANRAFLHRAVRYLASQGLDQFLDLGAGIPTSPNTHEVARAEQPGARTVYVDHDPIVLAHARALMTGSGHGATQVVAGDVREPDRLLADVTATGALDFQRPVALLLVAVGHFLAPADEPQRILATLLGALPSGSCFAFSHVTADFVDPAAAQAGLAEYNRSTSPLHPRSRTELLGWLAGLEPVEPGLVTAPLWRPDGQPDEDAARAPIYAAVARKP